MALKACDIGVWELELETGHLHWDERVEQLFDVQYPKAVYGEDDWRSRLHPEDLPRVAKHFRESIELGTVFTCTFRILTCQGNIRHVRAFGIVEKGGNVPRVVGANWDVTGEVAAHEALVASKEATEKQNDHLMAVSRELEYQNLHDALTGLANRRSLDLVLARPKIATGSQRALVQVDIDRFKYINDVYGHQVGDAVLQHVASLLRSVVSPDDFVSRIGGDQFVVIVDARHDSHVNGLTQAILQKMSMPIEVSGRRYSVSCSMGAAVEVEGDTLVDLMYASDASLREAKKAGGRQCVWFNENLRDRTKQNRQLRDGLRRALDNSEFEAFFQPQFCAQTLKIVGAEVLVRWNHPQMGLIPPNLFLPIASELNLLADIDSVMLEKAIDHMRIMERSGIFLPKVSVNVSAQRLKDPRFCDRLNSLPKMSGSISIELLESISFEENDEALLQGLEELRKTQIDIEIDDFGTGHASILSLLRFAPKRLKIDRQLTSTVVVSMQQRRLIAAIVEIGKSQNIGIVAEGVETMEHARVLAGLGCDILQGFALARPMPSASFLTFASTWNPTALVEAYQIEPWVNPYFHTVAPHALKTSSGQLLPLS